MSQYARQRTSQQSTPARSPSRGRERAQTSNSAAQEELPQGAAGAATGSVLGAFAAEAASQSADPVDPLAQAKHENGDYGPDEIDAGGVEDGFAFGAILGNRWNSDGDEWGEWGAHRDSETVLNDKRRAKEQADSEYRPLKEEQDEKKRELDAARSERETKLKEAQDKLENLRKEREKADLNLDFVNSTLNPDAHRAMTEKRDEKRTQETNAAAERDRVKAEQDQKVADARAAHDDKKRAADARKPDPHLTQDLKDAESSERQAYKKKTIGPKTRDLHLDQDDTKREGQETHFFGGRAGYSKTFEKESIDLDDVDVDTSVSMGMGGSEIEMRGGFQGDIAGMETKEAKLAKGSTGEGADGVFFESTRGKGESAGNSQAYVGNAAAKSGSTSQGGNWLEGDLIGAHAQAEARAGLLGVSGSSNAATEGGPALGGIDPVTGKRRSMLSAEAGADIDARAMEAGAAADSQAYVQGTRAGAAANASADASLIKATGGANAGAGVELGGVKLAAVEAGVEGSGNVGARGEVGAAAEVGLLTGIKAKANAEAFAGAEAEGSAKIGATLLGVDRTTEISGRGMAGVEADGEVGMSTDLLGGDAFVKAEGEAFAGAKVEGAISDGFGLGGMDLVTVNLEGSLRAGIGVGASFLAGMVDAALEFFAEANLTVGAGLGAGIGLNVGIFTPVKFVFQTLEENGVVSSDPDDWVGQFVTLCQTGKVLRSDQQGTGDFAPKAASASPAKPAPTPPPAGSGEVAAGPGAAAAAAAAVAGGPASAAAAAAGPLMGAAGPASGAAAAAAGPLVGAASGPAGAAAAGVMGGPATAAAAGVMGGPAAAAAAGVMGGPAAAAASPLVGAAGAVGGPAAAGPAPQADVAAPQADVARDPKAAVPHTEEGADMLQQPESLQLDEMQDIAEADPAMEGLSDEIAEVWASLQEELAPIMDIEERWKENFQNDSAALVDTLVGPMADLWDLVDTALSGVFALITGDIGTAMESGEALVEQAGELIDGAGALLGQALTDPVGAIEAFFSKFDGMRALAEGVLTMATGGIAALQAFFEGEIGPAQAISGMIRAMADGVLEILVGHGEEAAEDVREVGGATDDLLDEPVDPEHLGDAALTLAPGAREAIDEQADTIEDAGPEAVDLLMEGIDGAAQHVDDYIDGAVQHVSDSIDEALGVVDEIAQMPEQVAEDVFNVKDGLIVKALQYIAEQIAAAAKAFWSFLGF